LWHSWSVVCAARMGAERGRAREGEGQPRCPARRGKGMPQACQGGVEGLTVGVLMVRVAAAEEARATRAAAVVAKR